MNTDPTQPAHTDARRALWGWSPTDLPADTTWKRRVDRVLPRTGGGVLLYFLAVVLALNLAGLLPRRPELVVVGLSAAAAGTWCAVNFWRCRHAHCLVGGVAWPALAAFCFVEAGLGRTLIGGDEALVFTAILVAAVAVEAGWVCARGTNAIRPRASGRVC
ncbi:MAG: hypothetical protein ACREN2_01970 [Candidatus Dormibacteria bacterium]